MNTAALSTPNRVRLLTAADVAALPRALPSGEVGYELHDGRLVVTSPHVAGHGRRQARFAAHLFLDGEKFGHGEAYARVEILLRRDPDHLLCADAAFVTAARLPARVSTEGFLLTVPDLVVEIRSKVDAGPEFPERIENYLSAGVALVWVADPEARTVTAHRANQAPATFGPSDTLTALPVIPGFAVPVAELLPT